MAMRSPGQMMVRIRCQIIQRRVVDDFSLFPKMDICSLGISLGFKASSSSVGQYEIHYACLPSLGYDSGLLRDGDKISLLTGGRDGESGGGEFDGLKRAGGDGVVGGGGGDDGRVVPRRNVRHRLDRLFLEFVLLRNA